MRCFDRSRTGSTPGRPRSRSPGTRGDIARGPPRRRPAPRAGAVRAPLPAALFAKLGAHVTLTDTAREPEVLANLASARDANRPTLPAWTSALDRASTPPPPPRRARRRPRARRDVLYDKSPDFDRLFATVRLLLERSDNPCAVFSPHQHRAAHRSIQALLRQGCARESSSKNLPTTQTRAPRPRPSRDTPGPSSTSSRLCSNRLLLTERRRAATGVPDERRR